MSELPAKPRMIRMKIDAEMLDDGRLLELLQKQAKEPALQLTSAPYVTVRVASVMTGLTERAIRAKISEGKWIEGREYRRAPDGGIFISIKGFVAWIESAPLRSR